MQVKEIGKALTALEQFLGMRGGGGVGGTNKKNNQTLIFSTQQNRYPLCDPCPFVVTGETSWLGGLTVHVPIPVPCSLSKARLLSARWWHAITAPDRNCEGATLPFPFRRGDCSSQLFSRQVQATEIWHWRDVTLRQGKSVTSPPSTCARKEVCIPVWFMVFNSHLQQRSTCLSVWPRLQQRTVYLIPPKNA